MDGSRARPVLGSRNRRHGSRSRRHALEIENMALWRDNAAPRGGMSCRYGGMRRRHPKSPRSGAKILVVNRAADDRSAQRRVRSKKMGIDREKLTLSSET